MNLAQAVRQYRNTHLVTRAELAQQANLSALTVTRVERDDWEPELETRRRLLKAIGLEPEAIEEPRILRELRRHHLMSQLGLAERSGVALRTIHSIEKGHPCSIPTRRKILKVFGIPLARHREVFGPLPHEVGG
jgi:DNA-binding XRE family transcriptional regulator